MRTGLTIRTGVAGLALWGSLAFGQEGPPALSAIQYTQLPAGSRLTLRFVGEIRYAISRSNDRLTLRFPGTTLATAAGARKLQFQDGLVRSVTAGRAGADSLVVVVVLRERTTSTLVRPSTGDALYIDVARDPDAPALTAKPASVTATPAPQRDRTASSASLVDIPTLARTQMEERRRTPETMVLPASGGPSLEPVRRSGQQLADPVVIAAAVILSAGSTLGLLMVLRRRTVGTPAAHRETAAATILETTRQMPDPPAEAPQIDEVSQEDAEPLFDDRVQMARIFQRGKEEVNLAMALRARTTPRANKQRLAEVVEKRGSNAQRRTAARKLGVGVGEVELAVHLKNMQNRTKQKEGAK